MGRARARIGLGQLGFACGRIGMKVTRGCPMLRCGASIVLLLAWGSAIRFAFGRGIHVWP